MTAISILVVLLAIGLPNFSTMISNQFLASSARDFSVALSLARSQARTQKLRVTLCKSTDGTSCSTLSTDYWEDGWIMFADGNDNGSLQNGELTLQTSETLNPNVTLRAPSEFTNFISFLPDGRAAGNGQTNPPASGEFRVCDGRGADHARIIDISPIGRSRVDPAIGASACP
jgi:type IV fimbrial biogenesis protein FimT